jgi:hypothetical protein
MEKSDKDTWVPSPMEIATLAAGLMGKFPVERSIETFSRMTDACISAAVLLKAAQEVADASEKNRLPILHEFGAFMGKSVFGKMILRYSKEETQEYEKWFPVISSLPENARTVFEQMGWSDSEEDYQQEKRCPWEDFHPLLYPKKPSGDRIPRFQEWLLAEDRKLTPENAKRLCASLKDEGVDKHLFVRYFRNYESWWKKEVERKNREAGKRGAKMRTRKKTKKDLRLKTRR